MSVPACKICANAADNRVFTVREMMFGERESFEYLECGECGCLQLLDVPEDLSRFYPERYYSLGDAPPAVDRSLLVSVKRARAIALLRAPVGVVDRLARARRIPPQLQWFAGLGLRTSSAVCDVGSGSGHTLVWMLGQGFSNVSGFDPYIAHDLEIGGRTAIRKLGVEEMPGGWDLIMLNHSFEHMAEPAAVLRELRERLNGGGSILIRVPVASGWAWRNYGTDWVQLDAPRHLFIPTPRSMGILAEQAGMTVSRVFFDSDSLQFWGSEQYRRDIPLRDPRSYAESQGTELFSTEEIQAFKRRAGELNREGAGDSAGFVLRPRELLRPRERYGAGDA